MVLDVTQNNLATAIRTQLRQMGINQNTVADHLGLSRAAIYRRLHGETDFTVSELYRVAELLGTNAASLLAAIPA